MAFIAPMCSEGTGRLETSCTAGSTFTTKSLSRTYDTLELHLPLQELCSQAWSHTTRGIAEFLHATFLKYAAIQTCLLGKTQFLWLVGHAHLVSCSKYSLFILSRSKALSLTAHTADLQRNCFASPVPAQRAQSHQLVWGWRDQSMGLSSPKLHSHPQGIPACINLWI